MKWMSLSGMPAARNWSASSFAMRGTSPRLWTVGISIACLNTSRVFACHAGSSLVGTVRGSVAPIAALDRAAVRIRASPRFIPGLLFARKVLQHQLPVDDIVVQRLHRDPFILAVGAEIDRD